MAHERDTQTGRLLSSARPRPRPRSQASAAARTRAQNTTAPTPAPAQAQMQTDLQSCLRVQRDTFRDTCRVLLVREAARWVNARGFTTCIKV